MWVPSAFTFTSQSGVSSVGMVFGAGGRHCVQSAARQVNTKPWYNWLLNSLSFWWRSRWLVGHVGVRSLYEALSPCWICTATFQAVTALAAEEGVGTQQFEILRINLLPGSNTTTTCAVVSWLAALRSPLPELSSSKSRSPCVR